MGQIAFLSLLGIVALSSIIGIHAESPYKYYTWRIYKVFLYPGNFPPQWGIVINGQFPGPPIECNTNDNLIITIINYLDEPFLMTWNGLWQRKSSWQDGVLGTNCPIPPRKNYTYTMQCKDQIGSYMYFPSTLMHRASGGFGTITIHRRPVIPLPYSEPAGDFSLLIGDWYTTDHKVLQKRLDYGYGMPMPDGILINGLQTFTTDRGYTGEQGKTYLFRVANVGIMTSINIRIQDHQMKLVEVEGCHVLQQDYESLDIHPGQSLAFLVTYNAQVVKDYYIVASTRFTKKVLNTTAILRYEGSNTSASGPLPVGPTYQVHWSIKQARTFRRNLTANAARPNPQGSFHYGEINITKTIILGNSAEKINGKMRYGVNNISYVNPNTPLKLADYYNIPGVFDLNTSRDEPTPGPMIQGTSVYGLALHDFVEIIFQNTEKTTQSWHLDGYNFFVVGRWQKKMHFLLTTLNVVYILSAPKPQESENETLEEIRTRNKWENDDYICRGHILNGMSDALFDIYQYVDSAKDLWDQLEEKYISEDASSKKFLVSNFNNFKIVETRPLMEQFHEIQRLVSSFKQHKISVDNTFLVSSIIDKLPPSWRDVRNTLKHKKDEMTIEELGAHLRIEEGIRAQDSHKEVNPNSSTINMVEDDNRPTNTKKRSYPQKKGNKGKKPKSGGGAQRSCWVCGKPGHFKKDCHVYKNKLAKRNDKKEDGESNPPNTNQG